MGVRIRTTMRPHEEIEVGVEEFVDLARQDLLVEVEGQTKPAKTGEQANRSNTAGK